MAVTKKKTKKVVNKKNKIICPECGGKLSVCRDAIVGFPLKGLKVGKMDKDVNLLDNNWLECECGEVSHDTDGNTENEALAKIYDKLKW